MLGVDPAGLDSQDRTYMETILRVFHGGPASVEAIAHPLHTALERVDASRVAAFLYIEPLVTLFAAMLLLGEEVPVFTLVGGVILLAVVVMVQRAQ